MWAKYKISNPTYFYSCLLGHLNFKFTGDLHEFTAAHMGACYCFHIVNVILHSIQKRQNKLRMLPSGDTRISRVQVVIQTFNCRLIALKLFQEANIFRYNLFSSIRC